MLSVTITTAVELTTKQLENIQQAVEKKYGKDITYQTILDSSIIGGVKVRIGSMEFNSSIQEKFNQLRSSLRAEI